MGGARVLAGKLTIGLDSWWDELGYKAAQDTFSQKAAFILAKLGTTTPPNSRRCWHKYRASDFCRISEQ